jgi:hypothetical protein
LPCCVNHSADHVNPTKAFPYQTSMDSCRTAQPIYPSPSPGNSQVRGGRLHDVIYFERISCS